MLAAPALLSLPEVSINGEHEIPFIISVMVVYKNCAIHAEQETFLLLYSCTEEKEAQEALEQWAYAP